MSLDHFCEGKKGNSSSTPNLVERTTSIIPGECSDPQCIERKKNLIEENNQLLLNIEEGTVRVQELEDDVSALRTDLDSLEAEKWVVYCLYKGKGEVLRGDDIVFFKK